MNGKALLWKSYLWFQVTFKDGRRTGYGHESTWHGDDNPAQAPLLHDAIAHVQFVVYPKRFYPRPNDLPTHRKEIELFPELKNLQR